MNSIDTRGLRPFIMRKHLRRELSKALAHPVRAVRERPFAVLAVAAAAGLAAVAAVGLGRHRHSRRF